MTVATHERLSKALAEADNGSGVSLVPTSGLVEELRSVKDEAEMAMLTRAIEISDRAFEEVSRTLRDGQTEREVAWMLERTMRELGADSVSFDTIVAPAPTPRCRTIAPTTPPFARGNRSSSTWALATRATAAT